jgi:Ni/Fe-hydrogenase subunit HybB-like protein
MIYNVFFLIIGLVGFLSLIPIGLVIVGGLIKKDKRAIIMGLIYSIIPVFCLGLYYWYN